MEIKALKSQSFNLRHYSTLVTRLYCFYLAILTVQYYLQQAQSTERFVPLGLITTVASEAHFVCCVENKFTMDLESVLEKQSHEVQLPTSTKGELKRSR